MQRDDVTRAFALDRDIASAALAHAEAGLNAAADHGPVAARTNPHRRLASLGFALGRLLRLFGPSGRLSTTAGLARRRVFGSALLARSIALGALAFAARLGVGTLRHR